MNIDNEKVGFNIKNGSWIITKDTVEEIFSSSQATLEDAIAEHMDYYGVDFERIVNTKTGLAPSSENGKKARQIMDAFYKTRREYLLMKS